MACGRRQQTFNLCTVTSVSGISSPPQKSLARRRGPDGPANGRLLVDRAAGFNAVGDVSGGPAALQRIDDEGLKNAGKTGDDWLTYGLNQAETRFSPLKQIDTTNVRRLGLEWSYDIRSGGGGQEATPLVWNGTVYGITNWSVVFAVDAQHRQGALALGSGSEPVPPCARESVAAWSIAGSQSIKV